MRMKFASKPLKAESRCKLFKTLSLKRTKSTSDLTLWCAQSLSKNPKSIYLFP